MNRLVVVGFVSAIGPLSVTAPAAARKLRLKLPDPVCVIAPARVDVPASRIVVTPANVACEPAFVPDEPENCGVREPAVINSVPAS